MPFSQSFQWGVASASYQIEGSPYKAGGGRSVWDMFCERPGAIADGSSGEVACDHYNRYREDVGLMAELGIPNYRLSVAWPRVIPGGRGNVSQEGLDFYDRLLDELGAKGIRAHVTLYHWDLPYELYQRGGWLNPEIVDDFARYTEVVANRLGDRVASWMTLNEPQVYLGLGLQLGTHAPGDKLNFKEVLLAGHHSLLAHGRAVQILRTASPQAKIGWAPVGVLSSPATESPEDVDAARYATFHVQDKTVWSGSWWNDPVFLGHYPEHELALFGADAPVVRDGDMELIAQPLDFFGANIYNAPRVKAGPDGKPETVPHELGIGRTVYHWAVTPESLYWGPKFFYERYGKPIVITENGLGLSDWVHLDGKVHDPQRIDFLTRYLTQLERAADEGVPVDGYFQWCFTDNFEWNEGLRFRFGLVHTDYQTQVRTPKDSAYWYRDVIARNGLR